MTSQTDALPVHLTRWSPTLVEALRPWLAGNQEWKRWDAPYYPPMSPTEADTYCDRLLADPDCLDTHTGLTKCRAITTTDDDFVGVVNWYWESRETDWRRLGIVLHDPRHWSRGFGSHALALWVDWLFAVTDVRRLDLATWSGNERMIRLAAGLGFREEGRFREAQVVDGRPYDAVVMGVLRTEWETRPAPNDRRSTNRW